MLGERLRIGLGDKPDDDRAAGAQCRDQLRQGN
jgi:hypothetical protein